MNRDRMREGVRLFLEGLAESAKDLSPEEIARSSERVAEAWAEDLVSGYGADPASILQPEPAGEVRGPVVVRDLAFASVCAHHLLPFRGRASLAYLPGDSITGLGHLARLVDALSRRLAIQERLTVRLADQLERSLAPRAALVVLEAEHQCLALRGARKEGHRVITAEARGLYREDPALRAEALRLLGEPEEPED